MCIDVIIRYYVKKKGNPTCAITKEGFVNVTFGRTLFTRRKVVTSF